MTKTKTKKPVEYVSRDMVRGEFEDFIEKRLPEIERIVNEKYGGFFSPHLVREISITACAKLAFALHLKGATFKDNPSYRQQLTMLYDFRQLLGSEREPKYFKTRRKDYYRQYENICTLLDEHENYQKTGEVNAKFLRLIEIGQENFPIEHAEGYLAYAREMTLVMIDNVSDMVREQIYRIFPGAPTFVQSILGEDPYEGMHHVGSEHHIKEDATQEVKKVTFSL